MGMLEVLYWIYHPNFLFINAVARQNAPTALNVESTEQLNNFNDRDD